MPSSSMRSSILVGAAVGMACGPVAGAGQRTECLVPVVQVAMSWRLISCAMAVAAGCLFSVAGPKSRLQRQQRLYASLYGAFGSVLLAAVVSPICGWTISCSTYDLRKLLLGSEVVGAGTTTRRWGSSAVSQPRSRCNKPVDFEDTPIVGGGGAEQVQRQQWTLQVALLRELGINARDDEIVEHCSSPMETWSTLRRF